MSITDRMVSLHARLADAGLDHAFGGGLALAWCTRQARGTVDIDLNVFVEPERQDAVVAALPSEVVATADDRRRLARDGQARLWWDRTPVDLFLSTTPFHDAAATRIRWEPFAGTVLPFLACRDLAVCKVFFDRTKDWADLEAMADAGALDLDVVLGTVVRLLGATDPRVERLRALDGASPE